jgi:hypothetical protein
MLLVTTCIVRPNPCEGRGSLILGNDGTIRAECNPWWSLGIFFLCVYIVHGIFIYGDDERAPVT